MPRAYGLPLRSATAEQTQGLSVLGNILWFVLAGWWLALEHLFAGILLCVTIIGIPLGVASFKMAGAALVPFGREVVSTRDLTRRLPEGAISVGAASGETPTSASP